MKILHWIGGAILVVSLYDMVAPSLSGSLPVLPSVPTSSNMTNVIIGGALFALPFFI